MTNGKYNDKEWLYQKYIIESLSTRKIANICNCTKTTIERKLKKFNISIRSPRESQLIKNQKLKFLEDKEWLYQKYIIEELNNRQIAELLDCDLTTIIWRLKQYNIPIRSKQEEYYTKNEKLKLLKDKDWMYKNYVINGLSTYKIAEIVNCDNNTVRYNLKELKIKQRNMFEAHRVRNNNLIKLENKEWLYEQYIINKKTTYEIAKMLSCSSGAVNTWLHNFGIPLRNISECANPNAKWDLLENKDWLYKKYIINKCSAVQIAKFCNTHPTTIYKWLTKYNIPIRDNKGENSYLWKGGISFEPYCYKFNNDIKEETRDIFNRVCFLCGKSEEENGKKLCVHHVDYNKGQGCGHSWTLVPLCSSCHAKTNFNRHFWFNLLQNFWLIDDTKNFHTPIIFITQIF